jgi:hypothetical protein
MVIAEPASVHVNVAALRQLSVAVACDAHPGALIKA